MRNIILIGFKSCGKSAVGKKLAKKLGKDFIDLDYRIEEFYARDTGKRLSFREIYKEHGLDFFRSLEKRALESVFGSQKTVLAVGGGTPLFFDNAKMLKKLGVVIFIDVEKEALYKRIIKSGVPAFINREQARQDFEELLKERIPKYEEIADAKVDGGTKTVDEIVEEILKVL